MNNKTKGAKKVEEVVKEEKEEDKPGFQSDEVDLSRTKVGCCFYLLLFLNVTCHP